MRSTAMSSSKYYIRGGGRWREIDVETGRVSGWAGTRFVFTKRGKLCVASRRAVLVGLKNLSQNNPTTVREGLQLPQMKIDHLQYSKTSKSTDERHHCCAHKHIMPCKSDADFNYLLKPSTNTVAVQCNGELNSINKYKEHMSHKRNVTHSSTTAILNRSSENFCKELEIDERDIELFRRFVENDDKNIFDVDLLLYDEDDNYKQKMFYKINPIVKLVRDKNIRRILDKKTKRRFNDVKRRHAMRKHEALDAEDSEVRRGRNKISHSISEPNIKIIEFDEISDSSNSSVENTEEIVNRKPRTLRKVRSQSRSNVIEEESRGNSVKSGHKDNLVVNSERSGDKHSGDKHNGAKNSGDRLESRERTVNVIEENARKRLKPMNMKKVNTHSRSRVNRDFSLLEDEAIVDWILRNDKAHCVKGNKVWKILQPVHSTVTGQLRTWQSLRNRYLRYILPSLGSLSVAPAQAAALRAAASAGEINYRKEQRRNSIFKTVRVRSAWNARPREKPRDSDDETSSPSRLLRSNTTAQSPSRSNLPTYSEITRRFAEKHRSTPNSDDSEKRDRRTEKQDESTNKKSQTDKQDGRNDRDNNTERKSRQHDRQNRLNGNRVSGEKRHRSQDTVKGNRSSDRSEHRNKTTEVDKINDDIASKSHAKENSNENHRNVKSRRGRNDKKDENNETKSVYKERLNENDSNRPLTRNSLKNRPNDADVESDNEPNSKYSKDKIRLRRIRPRDNRPSSEEDTLEIKNRLRTRQRPTETKEEYRRERNKENLKNNRSETEHKRKNRSETDSEHDSDIEIAKSKDKNQQINKRKRNDRSDTETDVDDSIRNQTGTRKMRINVRTPETLSKIDKTNETIKDNRGQRSHKLKNKSDNISTNEIRKSRSDKTNTELNSIVESDNNIPNDRKRRRIARNTTDTESDADFEKSKNRANTRQKHTIDGQNASDSEFDLTRDSQLSSESQSDSGHLTDSSVVEQRPITRQSIRRVSKSDETGQSRNTRLHERDERSKETDRDRATRSSRKSIVFESNSDSEKRNEKENGIRDGRNDVSRSEPQIRKVTRNLRRLFNPKAVV